MRHWAYLSTYSPPIYTHTTAEPEHSFKVSGIYWLPDYMNSNAARTDDDKGGGDTIGACGAYGFVSGCTAPKMPINPIRPRADLSCYKSCICPSSYQFTSSNCDNTKGWTLSGSQCDGKFNQCNPTTCPYGYTASLLNCNTKAYPGGWDYASQGYSGGQICGKCTPKACKPGLSANLTNCNAQAQPAGWIHSSDGYAGDSICGKCTAKSCPNGYSAGTTS